MPIGMVSAVAVGGALSALASGVAFGDGFDWNWERRERAGLEERHREWHERERLEVEQLARAETAACEEMARRPA